MTKRDYMLLSLGAVSVAGLLFAVNRRSVAKSQMVSCTSNLRLIDSAKEQWALENDIEDGLAVVTNGVLAYLPARGSTAYTHCRTTGAAYIYGGLREDPRCPSHGTRRKHHLPNGKVVCCD